MPSQPPEDDEFNTTARAPFDVEDLLEHGVQFEQARTLLVNLDGTKPKPTDVILVLGDHWTMWSAAAFKSWAARLLKQL